MSRGEQDKITTGTASVEIAEKLNISRSYVSRIEKKALKKLKAAYVWGSLLT